jgi:predicted DNA-binding transcriptional regulator AlpA
MGRRHTPPDTRPTVDTPDRLLTVRETCARLTISRSTLWRLARELPPVVIIPGRRIGYRERDISRWLDARTAR